VFRAGAEIARRACLAIASPGERWLDVGCGTGHLAVALAAAGLRVTGVDSDSRMIAAAEERFPEVSFASADASFLPFPDGSVDGVVATSVLGCLEDPAGFVAEAARVLRPAGKVVLTFTNRSSPLHAVGNVLALLERRRSPTYAAARLFSTAEAIGLLSQAGFAVDRLRYYNCFLGTARGTFPPRRFVSVFEPLANVHPLVGSLLGRNLLAVASKRQPKGA
jgi:ubiquinone/menaquinone biosynthesis C-methylase UbiE